MNLCIFAYMHTYGFLPPTYVHHTTYMMHANILTSIGLCMSTYLHTYTSTYLHIHVCLHVHTYIFMYVCLNKYGWQYIHIYIHTPSIFAYIQTHMVT